MEIYLIGNEEQRESALAVADGFFASPVDYPKLNGVFRNCAKDYRARTFVIVGVDNGEGRDIEMVADYYLPEHGIVDVFVYGDPQAFLDDAYGICQIDGLEFVRTIKRLEVRER